VVINGNSGALLGLAGIAMIPQHAHPAELAPRTSRCLDSTEPASVISGSDD